MDGITGTDGTIRPFTTDYCKMQGKTDSAICALAMAARVPYEYARDLTFPSRGPKGENNIYWGYTCNHHRIRYGASQLSLLPAKTLRATTHWDLVKGHSIVRVEVMGDAHAWHWVWMDRGRYVYDPAKEEPVPASKCKLYPIAAIRLMML